MRYSILNRIGKDSLFKRGLHEVISAPGEKLVLGYGYFDKKVIEDMKQLSDWISSDRNSEKEIIIIGSKDNNYRRHIKAAKYLDSEFQNLKIKVIIKDKNETYRNYHKKLAIKFTRFNKELKPSMALIGSSNFTWPAYNEDKDYNQELDILLWNRYVLEGDTSSIKNFRKKELDMLKRLRVGESKKLTEGDLYYIDKYEEMLNLLDIKGIDLRLELELRDIINEIEYYKSNKFSLKYVNERCYNDSDIDKETLKSIINSSETDMYYDKNTKKDEYVFDIDLREKILTNCILCFYRYAQHNLDEKSNEVYFENQYESFKSFISGKTKYEIINEIDKLKYNCTVTAFKKQTFTLNKIKGVQVYKNFEYMLGK